MCKLFIFKPIINNPYQLCENMTMRKKAIIFIILFTFSIFLGASGTLIYNYLNQLNRTPNFLNPESQVLSAAIGGTNPYPLSPKPYEIIGFLPYWLLNQADHIQYNTLTQIAYFGIEFDQNGQLKTREPDGSQELGLHRLHNSETLNNILQQNQNPYLQNTLVVKILNNPGIEAAISPANRDRVISEILTFAKDYNFQNINIDFEYIRTPPPEIKTHFTQFIKELRQQLTVRCQKSDVKCSLTIDIYADAALKQSDRLWQLADLAPYIDQFIVMGYDFHRTTSPQSGPVAPLRGAPQLWEDDLITTLRALTQLVPPQKIILGLPFYGYEWDTYTDQPASATIKGTGRLATYTRVQELLKECHSTLELIPYSLLPITCTLGFDEHALSPFLIYQDGEYPNQIWYEDQNSLKYKLQLIKQAGLAGLAIWALGYESPHPELWQTITEELHIP